MEKGAKEEKVALTFCYTEYLEHDWNKQQCAQELHSLITDVEI